MSAPYLSPLHENIDVYGQQVPQYIIRQEKQQVGYENFPYAQPQDLRTLQNEAQGGYYRITTTARDPQGFQEQLIYGQPDLGQNYIIQQQGQPLDLGYYNQGLAAVPERRRYNESLISSPSGRGRSVQYLQGGQEAIGQPYMIQQQYGVEPQYQEQYVVQREYLPQAQLQPQVQYGAQLGTGLLPAGPVQQTFVEQVPVAVQGSRRHSFGLGGMANSAYMQKSVINQQRNGAWEDDEAISRQNNSKFNRDGRGIFILGKGRLGLDEEKSSKYDGWDNYDDLDQGRGKRGKARPEKPVKKGGDQWGVSPQRIRRSSNPMSRSLTQTFFGGEEPYRNQQMISSQILGRQGPAQVPVQDPYYVNNQRILVSAEPQLIQQQPQQNVIYVTRQQEDFLPRAVAPGQEYIIQREIQPQLLYQGQQGPQVREYMNVIAQPERQGYLLPQESYQIQGGQQYVLPQDNIQLIETQGGVQYLKANENLGFLYSPSRSVQRVQENVQYIQQPQQQQFAPQFVSNQQILTSGGPQQQQATHVYNSGGENIQYVSRSVINQEPVTYVRREVVQNVIGGGDSGQQGFSSQNFQSSGQIANSQILTNQATSYSQYGGQNPSQSGSLSKN